MRRCAGLAEWHRIPLLHMCPSRPDTKPAAERQPARHHRRHSKPTSIVLARYMQILSDDLCQRHRPAGSSTSTIRSCRVSRAHSPYHKAHDHGVKLIGATAHYVSPELDEGPIIDQRVERVDHSPHGRGPGRGRTRRGKHHAGQRGAPARRTPGVSERQQDRRVPLNPAVILNRRYGRQGRSQSGSAYLPGIDRARFRARYLHRYAVPYPCQLSSRALCSFLLCSTSTLMSRSP